MFAAAILALLPAVLAAPAPSAAHAGIAIHSGSSIHLLPINATGSALTLGSPSTSYCPTSIDGCTGATNTTSSTYFTRVSKGTLSLDVSVPGGEQVYIASDGQAKFTQPHSADVSGGSVTGFAHSAGHLTFEDNDWIACPEGSSYNVYAASRKTDDSCTGFAWKVEKVADAETVWEYI